MQVHVKLIGIYPDPGQGKFQLEAPDNCSLESVIEKLLAEQDLPSGVGQLKNYTFIRNASFIGLDTCLQDGDEIMVVRPAVGG